MEKTSNTESFIESWEDERCLWDIDSVIHENCYKKVKYKKVKNRRKLAEQFSVLVLVLASLPPQRRFYPHGSFP